MGPLILISNHPSRLGLLGFGPYQLAHKTCKKLGANIIIIIIIIIGEITLGIMLLLVVAYYFFFLQKTYILPEQYSRL